MSRWPRYTGESPTAFHHFAPQDPSFFAPPAQSDALSTPTDEDIAGMLGVLLPKGAAWGTPDNQELDPQSVLARFWKSMGSGLVEAYRALFSVAMESTAVTLANSLEDWEIEYGLPDPCLGPEQTFDTRWRSLILKIRSAGTITPLDFIKLAADVGYSITIEEPMPFRAGASGAGGSDAIAGEEPVEFVWIVTVAGVPIEHFRVGEGRAGETPLGRLGLPSDLICLFRSLAPAWTRVIFAAA
jgi:uncharacterized protein YmfQ (DUF2313 family)